MTLTLAKTTCANRDKEYRNGKEIVANRSVTISLMVIDNEEKKLFSFLVVKSKKSGT